MYILKIKRDINRNTNTTIPPNSIKNFKEINFSKNPTIGGIPPKLNKRRLKRKILLGLVKAKDENLKLIVLDKKIIKTLILIT